MVKDCDDLNATTEKQGADTQGQDAYSIFTKSEKRWIVFLIAYAGLFSPLSSFIYYPALYPLTRDLHASLEMVNLTITSYMVVSGVVPSLLGDMAETLGRRPLYLGAMLTYCAANVGLAVQRSYWALFILRMVQSAGSSGTISFGYAVVSDIATPAERGAFVGAVLLGLGPVLGGILVQYAGWRWIFWTLTIMSGVCLSILAFGLPETAHSIVGNGSLEPPHLINTSYFIAAKFRTQRQRPVSLVSPTDGMRRRFKLPSLTPCFKAICNKHNALIMLINGIFYMTYCCVQASLSILFISVYHFKEVYAGLVYLPFGIGCALASYASGYVMNREYHSIAHRANCVVDRVRGDDLLSFPIETARLRATYIYTAIMAATTIGYGWALETRTHFSVPLALQFFIGASITAIFNACGTLLVDVNPEGPATASAASNLFRCSLAAGGLAALDALLTNLGSGWAFIVFTAISMLTLPMAYVLQRWGMTWRQQRAATAT